MARAHVGTQEVRIDLSGTVPRVYIDGEQKRCILEVIYHDPPAEPLTVKGIELGVLADDR